MNEIEVKIIEIDIEETRKKLEGFGAELVKNEHQINTIYDFEDMRLHSKKGYARIREVEDHIRNEKRSYMTTKKMISQEKYKEMEENETIIEIAEEGHNIFKSLDLKVRKILIKDRISYKYKNSLIEIDNVDHNEYPFPLLEIETQNEDELKEIVGLLGYTMKDITSLTMSEIVAQKNSENK